METNHASKTDAGLPAEKDYTPHTLGKWLVLLIQGAIIGVGAILPGVSGGVLCVVFGIYPPMMALLAHPLQSFGKYYRLFILVIIGWALGFLALAGVIAELFAKESNIITCLFVGLIAGMFPSLFREGARDGRTKAAWTALILSTALLLGLFMLLQYGVGVQLTPSAPWFLFCGALWGVSLIVPGMSSSSLLIFLGLYYPMSAGIAALNPAVIVPFVIGILLTVLLLARGVNTLFERHYGVAFHCIIGFVIASTIPIIPLSYKSAGQGLLCLLVAAAGFFATFYMDKLGERTQDAQTGVDT